MKRGLQYRRNKDRRAKRRAIKVQKIHSGNVGYQPGEDPSVGDPVRVGKLASTGSRPCNCEMCGKNPRHVPVQEIRAQYNENEQRKEVSI